MRKEIAIEDLKAFLCGRHIMAAYK